MLGSFRKNWPKAKVHRQPRRQLMALRICAHLTRMFPCVYGSQYSTWQIHCLSLCLTSHWGVGMHTSTTWSQVSNRITGAPWGMLHSTHLAFSQMTPYVRQRRISQNLNYLGEPLNPVRVWGVFCRRRLIVSPPYPSVASGAWKQGGTKSHAPSGD